MPPPKPSIGIYVPQWLRASDESDQMFLDELVKTIEQSKRYKPLLLNLPKLRLLSEKDARDFVQKHNLAAIVQHDSEFYKNNPRYANNVKFLEKCVPFFNSLESQKLGHDKIATQELLREQGIPVLDVKIIDSIQDFENHIVEGGHYVIKPHDRGAGTGVKLIKKHEGKFLNFYNKQWRSIEVVEKMSASKGNGVKVKHLFDSRAPFMFLNKLHIDFAYHPMLVEPYFNDHDEGFSSLRCTVIGDEVVEAVKRTNHKNITSNISAGGRATKIELSDKQKEAAVLATKAIGADYSGVDFLIRGNEWVIGEVNIGPFTLFSTCTGVNVGKIFGEYLIKKCNG